MQYPTSIMASATRAAYVRGNSTSIPTTMVGSLLGSLGSRNTRPVWSVYQWHGFMIHRGTHGMHRRIRSFCMAHLCRFPMDAQAGSGVRSFWPACRCVRRWGVCLEGMVRAPGAPLGPLLPPVRKGYGPAIRPW